MKKKITDVTAGMVLEKPVHTLDNRTVLLTYGTVLTNYMIKKLAESGITEVEIADTYTLFVKPNQQMSIYLKKTYDHIINKYSSDKPEGNLSDAMVEVSEMVRKTADLICKNDELLDFCLQMKILKNGELYHYSVLTSVFAGLVAGVMQLYNDMYNIMVGGLLHHIGCLEMPFLIGAKILKPQEQLLWKEHPVYGYYLAIQHNMSRNIAEIIQHHHENWDGSGYPNQLKGKDIPIGARIVGICSAVSSQIFYEHMQPYEAMEYIYGSSNIYFEKAIVDVFVGNITLYPLGTMVRLTTGEVGIISNVRKNFGPRPVVSVFYNRFNKPLSEPKIVDLGVERTTFISEILS